MKFKARMLAFGTIAFLFASSGTPTGATDAGAAPTDDATICQNGTGDIAIAACTRAIASGHYTGRNFVALYNIRGSKYAAAGDFVRALADQRTVIALAVPTDAWPWITLAVYQRDLKQYDAALESLRQAAILDEPDPKTGPGMSVYYHLGWTLQLMGRHQDAIQVFTTAIPKQPDFYWARFRRGLSYEQIGERDKAIQDFRDSIAHIPQKYWTDELRQKIAEYRLQPDPR